MAVDEQVSAIERSMETLFRLNASRKVYARRAAAAGVVISPPGLVLLRKLVELGAPSIGELARLAHMDAAATGRQVRELERDNLATRGPSDADGRVTVVRATARGRDVERRMSRVLDRHMEDVLQTWSAADRAEFARLMARLVADLRSVDYRALAEPQTV